MTVAVFSKGMSVPSMVDWLEFKVLESEFGVYRANDLRSVIEKVQDKDAINVAELDNVIDGIYEKIIEEIDKREHCLETTYPFQIEDNGKVFLLNDTISPGGYVYLYCLIFSHINRRDVLETPPSATNSDRDIMQICSTLAAANIAGGNAASFGWPRPDESGFLEGLRNTYDRFGEETEVRHVRPPGSSPWVKDGGVDVIAWEHVNDAAAGKQYILGQVASGDNWDGKAIRAEIEQFHSCFITRPASMHTEAMFIPHCIEPYNDDSYEQRLSWLTRKFGSIYSRHRLPLYANNGHLLADEGNENYYIERSDEFDKVVVYVEDFMKLLREAA